MSEEIQQEQEDSEIELEQNESVNQLKQEEWKPMKFRTAFWGVLGVHLLALAGIGMYSSYAKAQSDSDKKLLSEPIPEMVGVDNPVLASPTPSPTPAKVESPKASPTPTPKIVVKIPKNPNPDYPSPHNVKQNNSKLTSEYVVKQGDTFDGIVKRYKLNGERLKKINNIKDENKLILGQKLKFM